MLSIIIPAYNSEKTLGSLLSQLTSTSLKSYEIIVVDDASSDLTSQIAKKFKVRYFKLPQNKGAATARNLGAKKARGKILLFLDADVLPTFDLPKYISNYFKGKENENICITGFPGTRKENTSFSQIYKYWRDWSYWNLDKDPFSFYHFRPAIGAIPKKFFLKAGGYDQKYPGATMEDMEFSYRLAKKGRIIFKKDLLVKHQFGSLFKLTKSYFRRTTFYCCLFLSRRHFTGVAMTNSEATTIFFAGLIFLLIITAFLIPSAFFLLIPAVIYYLYLQRRFLTLICQKEGLIFTVKSILASFYLYLIIISAVIYFFLTLPFKKYKNFTLRKINSR